MATLLRHPTHDHPLVPLDLCLESVTRDCDLCRRKISAEAYTCQEECDSYYYHKACAEAPPKIEQHPLHPDHPVALSHRNPKFRCDVCYEYKHLGVSMFRCDECNFDLCICCALSTISDRGGSPGGKTPEQITLPLHPHPLTSFSTRHDFVRDGDCVICRESVEGDGYMCLNYMCWFLMHKKCIQDLYYADGTKAPRVYHGHTLEIFVGEDTKFSRCSYCGSDDSSQEIIGCASCRVFYHRDCIQVPEILQYPHHPENSYVLLVNDPGNLKQKCASCSIYLEVGEWCYSSAYSSFLVHVQCALQTLTYCKEGMSAAVEWTWHEHTLFLYRRVASGSGYCCYCGDESTGPTYACDRKDCGFLLHERCIQIQSTMNHPYHPDHLLTLCREVDEPPPFCKGCCKKIIGLNFSCEPCDIYLHAKCVVRIPTQKHYIHEHELLNLDEAPSWECNRCGTSTDSPLFRCVPCDLNLHEKCMELTRIVNSEIHWHPLTLRESYIEDDSGEYYCDHCEKRRDSRLGVYVCGQCSASWVYHVECALPELRKVYAKKSQTSTIKSWAELIEEKNEEIRATKEKLEEMERELDELVKKHAKLVFEEEMNYVGSTEGGEPEKSV